MWEGEVAWLQEHARVLRYDLRGQGASAFPVEAYSNHADLLALLNEIGEEEATLIGFSAGVQVALDVALEAPQHVRRMVLVSPSLSGYVPEEMPPFFADLSAALRAKDFVRANEVLLASPIMSAPPPFLDLVRTMVEDSTRMWTIPYSLAEHLSPPAIERLEEIQASTLLLVGEKDLEAIRAQSLLLERRLSDARIVTIAGGGHLLNMTSPDNFRKAVSAFLDLPGE
jgi:pimeloyl-ACP methyl ester carboxylesterase